MTANVPPPVGSAKYLVCNLRQILSQCAHAHKPLDCSHIYQQHSTVSTAQPARISSEASVRWRWQSKESTSAIECGESYKLSDTCQQTVNSVFQPGDRPSFQALAGSPSRTGRCGPWTPPGTPPASSAGWATTAQHYNIQLYNIYLLWSGMQERFWGWL